MSLAFRRATPRRVLLARAIRQQPQIDAGNVEPKHDDARRQEDAKLRQVVKPRPVMQLLDEILPAIRSLYDRSGSSIELHFPARQPDDLDQALGRANVDSVDIIPFLDSRMRHGTHAIQHHAERNGIRRCGSALFVRLYERELFLQLQQDAGANDNEEGKCNGDCAPPVQLAIPDTRIAHAM